MNERRVNAEAFITLLCVPSSLKMCEELSHSHGIKVLETVRGSTKAEMNTLGGISISSSCSSVSVPVACPTPTCLQPLLVHHLAWHHNKLVYI